MKLTDQTKQAVRQKFIFIKEDKWEQISKNEGFKTGEIFSGKSGESFIIVSEEETIFLIGLGKDVKNFEIQQAAAKFSFDNRKKIKSEKTFINFKDFEDSEIEALALGLHLGTYSYLLKDLHPFADEKFELISDLSDEFLSKILQKSEAIKKGQFACMEWLNKPQNHKQVQQFSQFLREMAATYSLTLKVLNREAAAKEGLGAFLGVNQGSAQQAAFTIIEYNSGSEDAKTVGLVGKCVLFDTGGISIKPSENMHYMKSDMGGATAVLGTLISAAEMRLPINIVAILPVTDNAVSNSAITPSDVITAYNGKTIEVLNTDAEGRLTLADGLSYLAKNYKTDALIDLATLTGSSVRMFGNTCGALFSNNEQLKEALIKSGDKTNQRLWNMPLWDVWKEDFRSDVADFKNISLKPVGDCIVAAKFLEQFIEGHTSWAHLDIAGVAFGNVQYAKEKAATGYGVQLLIDFLENFS